jgi:hypothetical protein
MAVAPGALVSAVAGCSVPARRDGRTESGASDSAAARAVRREFGVFAPLCGAGLDVASDVVVSDAAVPDVVVSDVVAPVVPDSVPEPDGPSSARATPLDSARDV